MTIGKVNKPQSEWESSYNKSNSVAESASVIFNINKKKLKLKKTKIKDILKGLSEVAYSMGETNDPDSFNEEMSETLLKAFKEAEQRRQKKKRKKQ
mgnify:CR=1 FL=1